MEIYLKMFVLFLPIIRGIVGIHGNISQHINKGLNRMEVGSEDR